MQLRSVEYFCALARERHFARAAEQCGVSQPTLSAGIAALEEQLGQRLVVRDRRFIGLTPEGERVLPVARHLVAAVGALRHAAADPGPLRGELRLGAIPAAMPVIGVVLHALKRRHPDVRASVTSMTSRDIDRGLDEYALDAGLTYLDSEPLQHVLQVPLYTERYMLVAHRDMVVGQGAVGQGGVGWAEAAALPLCLLPLTMQNRRILDARLAEAGIEIVPQATANSYIALLSMLGMGGLASIMPHTYAPFVAADPMLVVHEIAGQGAGTSVGLVVRDRQPLTPLASAAFALAQSQQLRAMLDDVEAFRR